MRAEFKKELIRKMIHLTGISVPIVYYFFGRDLTILYTAAALLLFVILEFVRVRAYSIFPLSRMVGKIQRTKERNSMAANVYFCVAAVVSIYFFKEPSAIIGLSAALISDAVAALVGSGVGGHRLKSGKSLKGTVAGAFSAIAISVALGANLITAAILGIIFCLIDLNNFGFDDNFVLPLLMTIVVEIGWAFQ